MSKMQYCWDMAATGRTQHLFPIGDGIRICDVRSACGKGAKRCEVRRNVIHRLGCKECMVIANKLNATVDAAPPRLLIVHETLAKLDPELWISAKDALPQNARHVLAIIEDKTEDDPFRRYRVRMLWRKMQSECSFSGWWDEPGGGGLVREDLIIYWRELPAPPPEIAKHFTAPAILKKYGERFGDHYPALKTLLP